jgi:hypothetical protein
MTRIVVNCAGRTRAIIGAQHCGSGLPNRIISFDQVDAPPEKAGPRSEKALPASPRNVPFGRSPVLGYIVSAHNLMAELFAAPLVHAGRKGGNAGGLCRWGDNIMAQVDRHGLISFISFRSAPAA